MATQDRVEADDGQPALMLVHVTDLHVKAMEANAYHPFTGRLRALQRGLLQQVEGRNLFGYHEGTQGHYRQAPAAFARFLTQYRAELLRADPRWKDAQTWLVDTGDLTAFGDPASLNEGLDYLEAWRAALGTSRVRTLYGNHDAWPGTQPALNPHRIEAQRQRLQVGRWDASEWLNDPLVAPIPGQDATITLYGLDTVTWGAWDNTRAIGRVDDGDLQRLARVLFEASATRPRGLRVLAMHHPVAFPWHTDETGTWVAQMRLSDEEHVARTLRNDGGQLQGLGPWVHLILSGHTHRCHPAPEILGDVSDIKQRWLAPDQLQLVGGPLMLNKHSLSTRTPARETRTCEGFDPATVDARHCQAQILLFYATPDRSSIDLVRVTVCSVDGGQSYEPAEVDGVVMHY